MSRYSLTHQPEGLTLSRRLIASLIITMAAWCALAVQAATVSTYQFGRYEIIIQEGTPFAMSEILGVVRRQSGLPEYPLMLGAQKNPLELGILGPGNRPIRLASATSAKPARVHAATTQFIVERSVREGETLTLQLRYVGAPGQASFAVNLRDLERMLEGER
jgi:hypothetical protein